MSQLLAQIERLTFRLGTLEEKVFKNESDHQPAVKLCKKYEISRSLRDRLVREGILNEYRLFGKIYFKESEIITAMEGENQTTNGLQRA